MSKLKWTRGSRFGGLDLFYLATMNGKEVGKVRRTYRPQKHNFGSNSLPVVKEYWAVPGGHFATLREAKEAITRTVFHAENLGN